MKTAQLVENTVLFSMLTRITVLILWKKGRIASAGNKWGPRTTKNHILAPLFLPSVSPQIPFQLETSNQCAVSNWRVSVSFQFRNRISHKTVIDSSKTADKENKVPKNSEDFVKIEWIKSSEATLTNQYIESECPNKFTVCRDKKVVCLKALHPTSGKNWPNKEKESSTSA